MTTPYDVAVVGLGAMGAAAFYQLSKQNLNVIGIDKYTPPHSHGSSHGETRVTRQAIGEGAFYTPLVLRANEIWSELERVSGEQLFNHCGMLIAGHKEQRFVRNTLVAAKEFAIDYELLNEMQVEQRFPALNVSGKDHLFYYEPTSGFLKPEKCIETQLNLAQKNGAETLLNTEVKNIQETTKGVEITLLTGEVIAAKKIIVASGPWIKQVLPEALESILKTYLQTLYWFDVDPEYYEQLQPNTFPVVLCGDEKSEITRSFYGFPMVAGPKGGIKFAIHETHKEVEPDAKDRTEPGNSAEKIYRFASQYVRGLKPETVRQANCMYTSTPDGNFIIDFLPGSKRVVVVSACSGHGFKHSAAVGEAAAQLALDQEPYTDISAFKLIRFNKQ